MKRVLAMLLALVLTLALVACGGSGNNGGGSQGTNNPPATNNGNPPDDTNQDNPAPSGDKIEISVIASQYGQNTTKWWADFQEEFNKTYENINLNVEVVSWNDIYTVVDRKSVV